MRNGRLPGGNRGTCPPIVGRMMIPGLMAAGLVLAFLQAFGEEPREVVIRRGGSLWVGVERDGAVRIEGILKGQIEADGRVRRDGSIAGVMEHGGEIRRDGSLVGALEDDGSLRVDGTLVGRIEADGRIRRDGVIWGEASPCCGGREEMRRVAAVLAFFCEDFFGR